LVGSKVAIAVTPEPGQTIAAPGSPLGFQGENPDLAQALSNCLGFKFTLTSLGFDGIIPALQAGHFQMALASYYDTAPREQQVAYVDYEAVKEYLLVKKGNPHHITKVGSPDLCGVSVAEPSGSYEETLVESISAQCTQAGKPAVKLSRFASVSDAFQALASGRADVHIDGGNDVQSFLQSHSGDQIGVGPFHGPLVGAQFQKSDTTLQKAAAAAWKLMLSSGVEQDIFVHWKANTGSTPIQPKYVV
jgi:polar amino acid transport system substrate-binding protein